ncbi:MAG: hypothetical protein Q7R94_01910 [bacterium]|nr:hypothetical protein [bacterium]
MLNIQLLGTACTMHGDDFFKQIAEFLGPYFSFDSHHFQNKENFCYWEGKLRMVDYGSIRTRILLLKFGMKIFESFDPNYCWARRQGWSEEKVNRFLELRNPKRQ